MNIPEDFVLVTVVPIEEMLTEIQLIDSFTHRALTANYDAMLKAAPEVHARAYDEAKERELFTAFAMESFLSVHRGEVRDYLYAETETAWLGWKACAKSRARSAE